MKYLRELQKQFPHKECYVGFSTIGGDLEIQIRVGDYAMSLTEREYFKELTDEIIDREFMYMIEALKGKFEGIKEARFLP